MERNNEARVRADFIQVILGERAYGLILARIFNRAAVNCREQAITLVTVWLRVKSRYYDKSPRLFGSLRFADVSIPVALFFLLELPRKMPWK